MHERLAGRALAPRYTFPEAGRLTERRPSSLRRWALGHRRTYQDQAKFDEPLIQIDGTDELPLSFLNLIELRFLASYRQRVSLPAIRRALGYAAQQLGVERPLLELDFATHGRELFLQYAAEGGDTYFVNASRGGQTTAWPEAADFLIKSLDHDEAEHAVFRWWPLGKLAPVVLDTRLNGGQPCTAASATRTDVIAMRTRAGWDASDIAEDLAVGPEEIDAARKLEHVA